MLEDADKRNQKKNLRILFSKQFSMLGVTECESFEVHQEKKQFYVNN